MDDGLFSFIVGAVSMLFVLGTMAYISTSQDQKVCEELTGATCELTWRPEE